ncbi:oligopeptide/dipeptide ABC transporter ATP-binding protein [Actinoplanes tereljensis]|uniref:ABC transporter ATP-binding protein n=1 Tax=Paractinoplanes tereljensis TaxID=571912 RepID=A0A919NT04_9ACTN|nr:ABC transporter ATP-binding protein [Actinoplanes tereljensis]GIF23252.1 ABC transporter ATP-binding protein [Actinoplanes tereljensis]
MSLLDVSDLRVLLPTADGLQPAVDGVGFTVGEREIVGVAGESGSGKTISMLALLGLTPPGARVTGSAGFGGQDLLALKGKALRDVRGRSIAVVFQDPMTSLHPMLTIGRQLTEHVRHHLGLSKRAALDRAAELLDLVRIPDPRGALGRYPHQFSGGMRQRIAIAMALGCSPDLLIADEPTTALDVTVQAGILRLLDRLRTENGLSIILITHDLGVLSSVADRLYVYYAGRIVETGATSGIIQQPRHPYTQGLLRALPRAEDGLTPIGGTPPSLGAVPAGCAFHPRCAFAEASCAVDRPELVDGLACPINPLVRS